MCFFSLIIFRLGDGERALKHYEHTGDECDLKNAQNLKTHMINYQDARKLKDWTTMLKESELAISSGADSAPQANP